MCQRFIKSKEKGKKRRMVTFKETDGEGRNSNQETFIAFVLMAAVAVLTLAGAAAYKKSGETVPTWSQEKYLVQRGTDEAVRLTPGIKRVDFRVRLPEGAIDEAIEEARRGKSFLAGLAKLVPMKPLFFEGSLTVNVDSAAADRLVKELDIGRVEGRICQDLEAEIVSALEFKDDQEKFLQTVTKGVRENLRAEEGLELSSLHFVEAERKWEKGVDSSYAKIDLESVPPVFKYRLNWSMFFGLLLTFSILLSILIVIASSGITF
jgi:hypothetical protein